VSKQAIENLTSKDGILHRTIGLEYSSFKDVFEEGFKSCDIFEPFSERK